MTQSPHLVVFIPLQQRTKWLLVAERGSGFRCELLIDQPLTRGSVRWGLIKQCFALGGSGYGEHPLHLNR